MTFDGPQVIGLFGALAALQLGLLALFWKQDNRKANRIFALAMFLIGILFIGSLARARFHHLPYVVLHGWGALVLAIGPLFYLYIRSSMGAYSLGTGVLIHFLPSLLHLSLLLPLLITEDRASLEQRYLDLDLFRSMIPHVRIGALQLAGYAIASFFCVRRLGRHMRENASFSDQLHLSWLNWLTSLMVLMVAVLALSRLTSLDVETMGLLGLCLFLWAVNLTAPFTPALFHAIPAPLQLPPDSEQNKKYEHSPLDEVRKQAINTKLRNLFEQERPYLREDLTLNHLCQALAVPRAYLSQVLNEEQGRCFQDFVNDYRIAAAKRLLKDTQSVHLSIEGIATEVGFRSRSAFYAAFKKRTGKTPTAWRNL